MSDSTPVRCPACGASVTAEGAAWCSWCGLELGGPEAGALRALADDLAAIDRQILEMSEQRRLVAGDLARRQWEASSGAPRPGATFVPPAPPPYERPRRAEWRVDTVRSLLLWLGATLLALSALTFTAVAWAHLGDGGRAAMVAGATAVAIASTFGLQRRLPATAEAFAGLAIALAVIDWHALRRAGVGAGLSAPAWWAWGTAAVAVLAFALARATPRTARMGAGATLPASSVLVVVTLAGAPWSGALGLLLVAFAIVTAHVVLSSRVDDPVLGTLLRVEAGLLWIGGATLAGVAAAHPHTFTERLLPSLAVLTAGAAPAASIARRRADTAGDGVVALAACTVAAVIASATTLASASVGPEGLAARAVVLGTVIAVGAPWARPLWRRASLVAATLAVLPGLAWAATSALVTVLGPLGWLGRAWTGHVSLTAARVVTGPRQTEPFEAGWPAFVVLAAVTAGIVADRAAHRARRPVMPVEPAIVGIATLVSLGACLAPVVGRASVSVAWSVTATISLAGLGAIGVVDRANARRATWLVPLALGPGIAAIGWSAVTPGTSLAALAALAFAAAATSTAARSDAVCACSAALAGAAVATLAGVATVAAHASTGAAGFAAAVTAGAVIVAGTRGLRGSTRSAGLELAGAAAVAGGLVVAAASRPWIAGALTANVALLAVAAMGGERVRVYGIAAGGAALGATWAWLAAARVGTVEAYTLPAAAVALAAGVIGWRAGVARSWITLAPAIALALGPTLAIAVDLDDTTRTVGAAIGATIVVLVGAWKRLQAPLVLGAGALLVLAVDTLGPAAARLPRWLVLAVAGVLLVWTGATFERRREDVRRATRTIVGFG